MEDDEEEKVSTLKKSQLKEKKRLKRVQDLWDLGQD